MGRSVPSLGKGASAAHESLALSGLGGSALSARALQAVSGVRGASGVGPGGVQSATASGDATGSSSSGLGSVAGNRSGFASVLARIISSRVGRGQSETRDAVVAGLAPQATVGSSNAHELSSNEGISQAGPASGPQGSDASRSRSSSLRRDVASAVRSVGRVSRALERARQVKADAPDRSADNAAARSAGEASVQATMRPDPTVASASPESRSSGGSPVMTPANAAGAVDAASQRIEQAVATGNPAAIDAAITEVAPALTNAIQVLLGQVAEAMTGGSGTVELGMFLTSAFDGTIPEMPTLTGTPSDQTSLAGLLVALRQMGATLTVDGSAPAIVPTDLATGGVSLDGAGVFGALASALATAADEEARAPVATATATAQASVAAAQTEVSDVVPASLVVATAALSDASGAAVIAVAEAGGATVVPIVAPVASSGTSQRVAGVDASGIADPGLASGDAEGVPTLQAGMVSAVSGAAGASGAGAQASAVDGDDVQAAPAAPVTGSGTTGSAGVSGSGMQSAARSNLADVASATSTTPGTSFGDELHDQVAPVLVRVARLTGAGEARQFTLRLSPENLGPLTIRLTLRQGSIGVDLTTSTPEARKALEAALPQLRASLGEAGLKLERMDVGLRERTDDQAGRQPGR
ncbi:MAG: flagellar hook-length control protein FliK, partial [Chloroflexi bacterium]|nr:flagellar hook-length control protein FliK [Chloroflexota bacterium]